MYKHTTGLQRLTVFLENEQKAHLIPQEYYLTIAIRGVLKIFFELIYILSTFVESIFLEKVANYALEFNATKESYSRIQVLIRPR